jgi:aspartate aminotransferase-like enzyme
MIPERLLLGPGPSPVTTRVMRAMANPVLSPTLANVLLFLTALERVLGDRGYRSASAGTAAAGAQAAVAH